MNISTLIQFKIGFNCLYDQRENIYLAGVDIVPDTTISYTNKGYTIVKLLVVNPLNKDRPLLLIKYDSDFNDLRYSTYSLIQDWRES